MPEYFVPHGHLSDEELQNEDDAEFNDPENLKFKLKLVEKEFDDERKKKTQKLKPRLIGVIWQNEDGLRPDGCSNSVWELMNKHVLLFNGPTVKVDRPVSQQADNSDDENGNAKPLGPRKLQISEKEIPDLIRLINGNQNNSKFLVKEFAAYLAKTHQPQREYSGASIMNKLKTLATWTPCPEEGCMFRKYCWYVPIDTRKRYNLNDLTFPNNWSYTIPPRNAIRVNEVDGENKPMETNEVDMKLGSADIIALSDDSNTCSLSETLTPELIKQASSKRKNYNIAQFIRPLTVDEKKKQFEPITLHRRPSEDQMPERDPIETPPTSQTATTDDKNGTATARGVKRASKSSSEASVPKKPKNMLVTQYLSPNVRKRKSTDANSDVTEVSSTDTKEASPKKRANTSLNGPANQDGPVGPLKPKNTLLTHFLSTNSRKRKSSDANSDVTDISSTNTAGTSDGAKKSKLNNSVIVID